MCQLWFSQSNLRAPLRGERKSEKELHNFQLFSAEAGHQNGVFPNLFRFEKNKALLNFWMILLKITQYRGYLGKNIYRHWLSSHFGSKYHATTTFKGVAIFERTEVFFSDVLSLQIFIKLIKRFHDKNCKHSLNVPVFSFEMKYGDFNMDWVGQS